MNDTMNDIKASPIVDLYHIDKATMIKTIKKTGEKITQFAVCSNCDCYHNDTYSVPDCTGGDRIFTICRSCTHVQQHFHED